MHTTTVLFLCTGNSARSQMAEALLREIGGDRFEVHSAGTDPQGVNPLTVRVLDEIGIDISQQRSKGVKEYLGRLMINYLIIVCDAAEKSCPSIWPGAHERLFWPFEDPAAVQGAEEERLAAFRRVRDRIRDRIEEWVAEQRDGAG